MNNNPNKILKMLGILFTSIGAISLTVSIVLAINFITFLNKAEPVDGVITEIERYRDNRYVYVSYTYNGEVYDNVRISFYTSTMYEGKNIELLVDPDKPDHVSSKAMIFMDLIPASLGVIFLTIGIASLVVTKKASDRRKNMLQNGMPIQATVESITRDYLVRYNGRNPFVLFCTYVNPATGMRYRFQSEKYLDDLNQFFQPGAPVTVFVDPMDYSRYYVDVDMVIGSRQFQGYNGM